MYDFVGALFLHVLKNKTPKMDHIRTNTVDLDFHHRELSVRGLVFVETLLFSFLIVFFCLLGEQSSCTSRHEAHPIRRTWASVSPHISVIGFLMIHLIA